MPVPLSVVSEMCKVRGRGVTATEMIKAGERLGITLIGVSVAADLLRILKLPVILFWKRKHFVVLETVSADEAQFVDPGTGRHIATAEELTKSYSGIALVPLANRYRETGRTG